MNPMTLELPDSVSADEAKLYLAVKLFEVGRLSCGQAAELAGYSKAAFMEILGKQGVAVFNYPSEDLGTDLEDARRATGQQQ